jgi:hypothetical protein
MIDKKLNDFYNEYKDSQFVYGVNDCMTFAARWVFLVTGVNYRGHYSGEYTSQLSAVKLLKKYGFNDPTEMIDSFFKRVDRRKAKRGALCSTQSEDGPAMGVYDGANGLFMLESGLTVITSDQIDVFWNIE